MKKFRLLSGTHVDAQKVLHKKGAIVESDKDLSKLFVNKFDPVYSDDPTPAPPPPPAVVAPAAPPAPPADVAPALPAPALGKNVTADFASAFGGDLVVYQSDDGYQVATVVAPERPLHPKPLKTMDKVNKFIASLGE